MTSPSKIEIQDWLVERVATLLQHKPTEIDMEKDLLKYGLDSMAAVTITGDLEDWLGREISPTLPYEFNTISKLSEEIARGAHE